jgi:tRNA pseudouridine55 synthase
MGRSVAKRPTRGRNVQGILLLDKPSGLSSNAALQEVRRLYRARKAGHTGSLDRIATGMLPICLGEATKLSGFLLHADKRYRAVFKLGVRTTTGDSEGEVLERCAVPTVGERDALEVLARFTGTIEQIPPMFSAVKHRGQRLYRLAHLGMTVDREPRTVTVRELRLLHLAGDEMEVELACSKGTYVRTLAEDIGAALGTGAHVSMLRRLAVGPFREPQMISLPALEGIGAQGLEALDRLLLPSDAAVGQWPAVRLSGDVSYYLQLGQPVMVPHAPTEGWVRLYGDGEFLGVGEVLDDGRIAPRRLVQAAVSSSSFP